MKRGGLGLAVATITMVASLLMGMLSAAPVAKAEPAGNTSTTTEQQGNSDDQNKDSQESCEAGFMGFGWVFCPGQNLITQLIDGIAGWISNSMNWTVLAGNGSGQIKDIWQKFLNIANVVFALVFLFMIYSMATSTGLSGYDIKKILPRLIVVAIAVNISFYLCAALVDLSNITGKGMYGLIYAQTDKDNWSIIANITNSVTSLVLLVLALFLFGGTVIIGLAITLIAIAFRQLMLVVLVIVSPVAFALYLLPNTQKWAQKWLDMFGRLLIIYPMFTAVWGASRLVSNIFSTTDTSNIPAFLMDFLCAIAPALAIMPLFKTAGGIVGGAIKTIEGNDAVKKARSGINKAERGLATNSQMAGNLRRWGSGQAVRLQNNLGSTPVIGSIVRGPAFNKAASYSAADEAKRDKEALEAGTNWVNQNLNSKQIQEVLDNGNSYTDSSGHKITLTDSYKVQAAIEAGKGGRDNQSWIKGMHSIENLAADMKRHGRGREGQRLITAYSKAMLSEKTAPLSSSDINKWADAGGWGADFDKKASLGVAKYAAGLSQDKASTMSAGGHDSLQKIMSNAPIESMTAEERATYDKNVKTYRDTVAATAKNDKLTKNINNATRTAMSGVGYLRNTDEQERANQLHVDQIIRDYNSGDRTKVGNAVLQARRIYQDPHRLDQLRQIRDPKNLEYFRKHSMPTEQDLINHIANSSSYNTSSIPPVGMWKKD